MACQQPNDHAQLVDDILTNYALPLDRLNYYDVLRLPGYKTYAEHQAHRQRIRDTLLNCSCAPNALQAVNNHDMIWNSCLSSALQKQATDGQLTHPPTHPIAEPIPAPRPPPLLSTPQDPLAPSLWNPSVHNVEHRPTLRWHKHVPTSFCRKIENTFWTALSHSLWGSDELWAVLKASTHEWYRRVMADKSHPRFLVYESLEAYTWNRHNLADLARQQNPRPNPLPPLVASIDEQLKPTHKPGAVSPELWQIVADAQRIELLVISALPNDERKLPLIPRGDANTRQVFLLREKDGEYVSVRPEVPDIHNFRFDYHRPAVRASPPKPGKATRDAAAAQLLSDQKRCPLLKTRREGDGALVKPLEVIAGNHGVTVKKAGPPAHVLSEKAWLQWGKVSAERVGAFVNTTPRSWR